MPENPGRLAEEEEKALKPSGGRITGEDGEGYPPEPHLPYKCG